MKKDTETDTMQPEYDFSKGVRGKHYRRYQQRHTVTVHRADGTAEVQEFPLMNDLVQLAPDVQAYFSDAAAVNQALRCLIPLLQAKRRFKAEA